MPQPNLPTAATAARFLSQAGFGATADSLARLQSLGLEGWLREQFALASDQSHFDWMQQNGYAVVAHRNDFGGVDNTLWRKLISAQDVLRQRVVLSLSEIFVVSMAGLPVY